MKVHWAARHAPDVCTLQDVRGETKLIQKPEGENEGVPKKEHGITLQRVRAVCRSDPSVAWCNDEQQTM